MKLNIFVCLIAFFLLITIEQKVFAVKFLWEDEKGTDIYSCERYCGKVRVKRIAKGQYRIFSVPFSGDIKATSEKQAAMKACREIDMGESATNASAADREAYGCGK